VQKDGSFKYVGGETYHEKIPAMRYADLMHYMSEKVNGAVTLKYSPPGEEVDVNNLVTCVDDDHVQVRLSEPVPSGFSVLSGFVVRLT